LQAAAGAMGTRRSSRIQVLPASARTLGLLLDAAPSLHCYSGSSRNEVLEALREDRRSANGTARLAIVSSDSGQFERLRDYALRWLAKGDSSEKLPPGLHFAGSPVSGELAFVYTGAAAAYYGMGDRLLVALPQLAEGLHEKVRDLNSMGGWIYDRPRGAEPSLDEQLRGSSGLSQIHTELTTKLLGIKPKAVMGISSGETNSLFAMGAWQRMERMFEEFFNTGYYQRETAGGFDCARRSWNLGPDDEVRWSNLRVLCPLDRVREAMEGEPRVHILIVHTEDDCLIGGDEDGCQRVLDSLGSPPAFKTRGHVVHCPEMQEFAVQWHKVHKRPTTHTPGVRFYANAIGDSYNLSDESVADNLLAQATTTIDFPRTVLKAYEDGVRIFIEHGPRSSCSGWISKILGDKPHLALSLDHAGRSPVEQAANAVAQLVANGVECNYEEFFQRLQKAQINSQIKPVDSRSSRMIRIPVHPHAIKLPEFVATPDNETADASEIDKADDTIAAKMPAVAKVQGDQTTVSHVQSFFRMEPAPILPLWQENPPIGASGDPNGVLKHRTAPGHTLPNHEG